jgi:hypothetical protein
MRHSFLQEKRDLTPNIVVSDIFIIYTTEEYLCNFR